MTTLLVQAGFTEIDDFLEKVPRRMQGHMTAELRTEITSMLESEVGDAYREGLMVNTDLMEKYNTNPDRYARAVKFVTYLNMGKKTYEAFSLSHPEKYAEYKKEGLPPAEFKNKLSLKGANFKKTQIVTYLLARSMIPLAVANMHRRQEAVEKLVELMQTAGSERVQMESADKLLTHLNLDKTEFSTAAEIESTPADIVSTLAGVLDKMVSMHQNQKEINPLKSNSEIIEGIVMRATKGGA